MYGQPHAEGRTLTPRRVNPDAPTVHLDHLSAIARPKPRAALGPRIGAVDLPGLLDDVLAFLRGDAARQAVRAQIRGGPSTQTSTSAMISHAEPGPEENFRKIAMKVAIKSTSSEDGRLTIWFVPGHSEAPWVRGEGNVRFCTFRS
jgi:hypothetical protein